MVAMDEEERPLQVPGLLVKTEAEKARYEAGLQRREMRRKRQKNGF